MVVDQEMLIFHHLTLNISLWYQNLSPDEGRAFLIISEYSPNLSCGIIFYKEPLLVNT